MTSVKLCKWRVDVHQASSEWMALSWENQSFSQIFVFSGLRCVDEWMPLSWWTFSEQWQSFCWRACFEMASLTCAISNEVQYWQNTFLSIHYPPTVLHNNYLSRCLRCQLFLLSLGRFTKEGSLRSKISLTQSGVFQSMIFSPKVH